MDDVLSISPPENILTHLYFLFLFPFQPVSSLSSSSVSEYFCELDWSMRYIVRIDASALATLWRLDLFVLSVLFSFLLNVSFIFFLLSSCSTSFLSFAMCFVLLINTVIMRKYLPKNRRLLEAVWITESGGRPRISIMQANCSISFSPGNRG